MNGRSRSLGRAFSVVACVLTACGPLGPGPGPTARTGADGAAVPPASRGDAPTPGPSPGASDLTRETPIEADVRFMQDMILHHAQALEMAALVPDRSERDEIRVLARRIEVSQLGEIRRMQQWLERRGQAVPRLATADAYGHHHADRAVPGHPAGHAEHAEMPGMLSPEQMARLEAATGEAFNRLFLELMIQHHEGAILMVEQLLSSPAGGQDSDVFALASHVHAEQRMEITRMQQWLGGSTPSPDD